MAEQYRWNQQAGIGCKYLSGINLPRIELINGLVFTPFYCLSILVAFVVLCRVGWCDDVKGYVRYPDPFQE